MPAPSSARNAPACAAASTPRAMPLTTAMPWPASASPSASAMLRPAAEALRLPTTATDPRLSRAGSPSTAITGGASSSSPSSGG